MVEVLEAKIESTVSEANICLALPGGGVLYLFQHFIMEQISKLLISVLIQIEAKLKKYIWKIITSETVNNF